MRAARSAGGSATLSPPWPARGLAYAGAERVQLAGAINDSSKASSAIELARTIIRRAERWCVTLGREGLLPGEHLLAYLNRLADLLWLLARQAEKLEASATRSVSQTPVRD